VRVERGCIFIYQIRWYRRSFRAFVLVEILGQKLFLCAWAPKGILSAKLTGALRAGGEKF